MNGLIKNIDVDNLQEIKNFFNDTLILTDDLKYVLSKSENILVLNFISYKLRELDHDGSILETLIRIIKNPNFRNKKAKIISVCEEYDCSNYFDDFLNVIIEEDGESCLNAIDVVSKMSVLPNSIVVKKTIERLHKEILTNPKKEKNIYLKKLIEFLKR